MSKLSHKDELKREIKTKIKKNIAKAWYQLDSKSYEVWLEGRRARSAEAAA